MHYFCLNKRGTKIKNILKTYQGSEFDIWLIAEEGWHWEDSSKMQRASCYFRLPVKLYKLWISIMGNRCRRILNAWLIPVLGCSLFLVYSSDTPPPPPHPTPPPWSGIWKILFLKKNWFNFCRSFCCTLIAI